MFVIVCFLLFLLFFFPRYSSLNWMQIYSRAFNNKRLCTCGEDLFEWCMIACWMMYDDCWCCLLVACCCAQTLATEGCSTLPPHNRPHRLCLCWCTNSARMYDMMIYLLLHHHLNRYANRMTAADTQLLRVYMSLWDPPPMASQIPRAIIRYSTVYSWRCNRRV